MKNLTKIIGCVVAALLLFGAATAEAKPGKETFRITLKIEGNHDTMMVMGCYFAAGNRVIDTAYRDSKDRFVFSGTEELKPGMYFIANPQGNYMEFAVYHEKPFFKFTTNERNWATNMKVEGSRENELMYEYQRLLHKTYSDLDARRATMDSAAAVAFIRDSVQDIIYGVMMDFVKAHPDCMTSKVMMATHRDEPPTHDSTGRELTNVERYYYYADHYLDNMPLDDEMIIRTPKKVFYQSVMDYVDKVLKGAVPSEIIPRLDAALDRATPDGDVFQWLLLSWAQKYLQSNVMSYDEVYVHLILKYYANATWAAPSSIEQEVDRASKWDRLLIGREAPELIMYDTLRRAISLHRLPFEYKLLIFWSPSCGHCKKTIPQIYEHFLKYSEKVPIAVYAVLTEPDENSVRHWKLFLEEHGINHDFWLNVNGGEANIDWREVYDIQSTPQIYLLDKDNKILAKKLDGELFDLVMKNLTAEQNTTNQK